MPCDVSYKLCVRSEHVNGVDFHPTKPWLLTGLDKGTVNIYSLESGAVINTFEVTSTRFLCARFIARKDWLVVGSGVGQLHVFNYNTNEEVVTFKAHSDSVNCLAIHPTAPLALTGSADRTIKAWDWDGQWDNTRTYRGHNSPVMSIALHPNNANNFASSSAGNAVEFWSIVSPVPIAGPNDVCGKNQIEFHPDVDKSYAITAAHGFTIKIWGPDKKIIKSLQGHIYDINFAVFHPNLPVIISGGYDGTIKIWNTETFMTEHTLNYKLGWAMCVALRKGTNEVAVGFSSGVVVFELGHPGPKFSVNHPGNLIYAHDRKVLYADLRILESPFSDGAQISLETSGLGAIKITASSILHSPNGRFISVIGDGKFIIHATVGWHIESFGTGISFAWSPNSSAYAVLETQTQLKIYKDLQRKGSEGGSVGPKSFGKLLMEALYTGSREPELAEMEGSGNLVMEALHTGPLLGARGLGYVIFWDWETGEIVRKVDIDAKNVHWSTTGTRVAIASSDALYIFHFDRRTYQEKFNEHGPPQGGKGIPESFILLSTLRDTIETARWFGDFLICATPSRLCYLVSPTRFSESFSEEQAQESDSYTISQIDKKLYLLDYIPTHERVYVMDEDMKVFAFGLSLSVVNFHLAVSRGDMGDAKELLNKVPKGMVDKLAGLLEDRITKELAMYKQCTGLVMGVMDTGAAKKISELRDDKAQDLAEFFSKMVIDKDTFAQRNRKHTLHILSKLAKSAGVFPQSLVLEGVKCNHTTPVTWGGYGVIYKGDYKGIPICVKAVQVDSRGMDEKKLRAHASELIIWAHLEHLNVLPFLGIYASQEEVPRICIVSPWMNNGDLLQYLIKVPEAPRKPLVCDIISGLQYLHHFDIIHADLKAKNVLVSETGRAMLADFGISRLSMTQTTTSTNAAGSLYWMAPELLLDDDLPSCQSDVWAFACTCYEMIALTMPFSQQHSFPLLVRAFRRGEIIPLKPEEPGVGWDEDVWSLAMRCWKSDPSSRPLTRELLDLVNSFNYEDNRSSDSKFQRKRSSVKINYDRILSILEEVHQSLAV